MTRCELPWWLYCHPAGFTCLLDDRASCCTGPAALFIAALSDHGNASLVAAVVKNPPTNAGDARDAGSIPGSGRYPGEGNGNPLQCSCLENPRDGGAWWAAIDGVTQSWTRLKRLSSSSSSSSSLEMHLELWRRKSKPGQWYFSEKIQDYSDIFLNLKNKNKK